MQLYLSSYKLGKNTSFLQEWLQTHKNNKIAIIPSALDVYPDGERKTSSIEAFKNELNNLGFDACTIDLKKYFEKQEELTQLLKKIGGVFVMGGNTFVLRQAMKISCFDKFIESQISNDDFLYMGFSAGICVLSKSLNGIHLADDQGQDPYKMNSIIWDGIGIIDYLPVPHWDTPDHPESHLMPNVVKFLNENNLNYKTIKDGEVIIENTNAKKGLYK